MRKFISVVAAVSVCVVCTLGVFQILSDSSVQNSNRIRLAGAKLLPLELDAPRSMVPIYPKVIYPKPDRPFPAPPKSTPYTDGPRPSGGADAMLWLWSEMNWPYGPSLPIEVLEALNAGQFLRLDETDFFPNKALDPWEYVGNVGMDVRDEPGQKYTGRITDIRTFPGGGIRVSTPNGGLWEKVGGFWGHLTEDFPVLGIGSFDIHPTDPNTMIAGTGDHARGGGMGFFRTTDAGSSWENLGNPNGQVYQLRYEPASWGTNNVHAATAGGHFRSTAGGDPLTWSNQQSIRCTALAFDPSTPGLMYSGYSSIDGIPQPSGPLGPRRGGLFRSTDSGSTWQRILDPALPDSSLFGLVSLDICTNQPQTVYALASRLTVTTTGTNNAVNHRVQFLFRSDNRGLNWTSISIPAAIDANQGWYNHLLAVDPNDPNTVLIGGVNLYRTTDGGATWSDRLPVHADQHSALWIPGGGDQLWVGNDGGLYFSDDDGQTFDTNSNTLPITQYDEISVCVNDPNYIVGGAQDNGLSVTRNLLNWEVYLGGDGGGIALRKTDCNYAIGAGGASDPPKAWNRHFTDNAFAEVSLLEDGIDPNGMWYIPIRWPGFVDIPYTATEDNVYRNSDPTSDPWEKLNTELFDHNILDMTVDELGIAVYVTLDTTSIGDRIQVYQDGTWNNRDLGDLPDGKQVRKIRPHPTTGLHGDAHALTRTFTGFVADGEIFKTSDFGVTWTDISGDVGPIIPNDIIGHPTDPNQIYVATTLGMVWTPNGGTNWFDANTGFPDATTIRDLYVVPDPGGSPGDYFLYAGTFSNGVYRRRITAGVPGPPDASKSVAIGAGEAHPDSTVVTMLAHPDGSGQSPVDVGARILVQILDSNSVPVPGIDADRITLHPVDSGAVECGYFTVPDVMADYATDSAGWTQFRNQAVPWGGYTADVVVRLDGNPLGSPVDFRVVNTDMNGDLRVDLLDMYLHNDAAYGGGFNIQADFVPDGDLDELDFAVLREAVLDPKNCPFEFPAMASPEGQLGLYFDEEATQTGRIVFPNGDFDLYVIAEGLVGKMRGVEFKIPGLKHAAVELRGISWGPDVLHPVLIDNDEYRVIFRAPYSGPGQVELAVFRCRLRNTNHVAFELEPVDAPTFGTPTIPGKPGMIDDLFPPVRRPFAEISFAGVNPFPQALHLGLQHQALGAAYVLTEGTSIVVEGLDSVTGGGIHLQFENAHNPGSKAEPGAEEKGVSVGVDGAAFVFGTFLDSQNTQPGSTIKLSMLDAGNNPVVEIQASRPGGLWINTVSMPAIGAQTYRLVLHNQGQNVLDDPNFGGTFESDVFLPQLYAVLLDNGEFTIDQEFGQSFLLIVDGNQYMVDNMKIISQTQGSAGTGMLSSGFIEGSLLPDITILNVGVQRFEQIFNRAQNVVLVNETDAFRSQLIDAADPGSVVINGINSERVDLNLVRPREYETNAAVNMALSDGDDPKVLVGLINGPAVHLTADLTATGSVGWIARGYLDGLLQWEIPGGGADIADASLWPGHVGMGPEGPRVSWPVPVQITGLNGAASMVNMLEIGQDGQAQEMPIGEQAEISFTGMAEFAVADSAAFSSVMPALPTETSLLPNVPNPFNPSTEIRYSLEKPGRVTLTVYDLRGRKVRSLLDGQQAAGNNSVRWDGRDDHGATVAAGVYHALLKTSEGDFTRKLVLVK